MKAVSTPCLPHDLTYYSADTQGRVRYGPRKILSKRERERERERERGGREGVKELGEMGEEEGRGGGERGLI